MYLVFTRIPRESHCGGFGSVLLSSRDVPSDIRRPWGREKKGCEAQFSRSQVWQVEEFTRPVSETTTSEKKGEPKRGMEPTSSAYQPTALPLGQISSG